MVDTQEAALNDTVAQYLSVETQLEDGSTLNEDSTTDDFITPVPTQTVYGTHVWNQRSSI